MFLHVFALPIGSKVNPRSAGVVPDIRPFPSLSVEHGPQGRHLEMKIDVQKYTEYSVVTNEKELKSSVHAADATRHRLVEGHLSKRTDNDAQCARFVRRWSSGLLLRYWIDLRCGLPSL